MSQAPTTAVVVSRPKSVMMDMADKFGMEAAAFEATLRATVVPASCSREQMAAFLLVAKKYDLDPITKQIYAFPSKSGGITPIVGIDGWLHVANSHPAFDGMEFDDIVREGELVAITCRVYRKDRKYPTSCTEYMSECKRDTDPWRKSPGRMLRHRATIQAIRYAFSFSGVVDEEEYALIEQDGKPVRRATKLSDFDQGKPLPAAGEPPTTPLEQGGAGGSPDGGQEPTDAADGQQQAETVDEGAWLAVQEGYFTARPRIVKPKRETDDAMMARFTAWRVATVGDAKTEDDALARCNTALDEMSQ